MRSAGSLGILFVTLLRRVMVEDPEFPFPESVAASEIHKAGQQGARRSAKILFANMGFGGLVYLLGAVQLVQCQQSDSSSHRAARKQLRYDGTSAQLPESCRRRATDVPAPRSALRIWAWATSWTAAGCAELRGRRHCLGIAGAAHPLSRRPDFVAQFAPAGTVIPDSGFWAGQAVAVWSFIVRPIAVGGMLVGACYTLFRMRKSLGIGMKRAVSDLKKSAARAAAANRTERDLNGKVVFGGLALVLVA